MIISKIYLYFVELLTHYQPLLTIVNLIKDLFDRGGAKNQKPATIGNFLTIAISTATLISGFSEGLLSLFTHYSGAFPLLIKVIPLIMLVVLLTLSVHAFTKKKKEKKGVVYNYSNFVRQLSKVFAVLSITALVYSSLFLYNRLKPLEQPLIILIKSLDGEPVRNTDIRILDESEKDITKGIATTDTENGMVILSAKSEIDLNCFLLVVQKNKSQVTIPLDELELLDSMIFGKPAYNVVLK